MHTMFEKLDRKQVVFTSFQTKKERLIERSRRRVGIRPNLDDTHISFARMPYCLVEASRIKTGEG